jgi:hypothetical protein
MNAIASRLATMKPIGGPGEQTRYRRQRQALAQPGKNHHHQAVAQTEEAKAKSVLARKFMWLSTSNRATPSTAQLVVISGR